MKHEKDEQKNGLGITVVITVPPTRLFTVLARLEREGYILRKHSHTVVKIRIIYIGGNRQQ
ncbi:MAG: hypothetical protein LBK61_01990 [Spirochaetaceae bacterium]|nr:hypothetical protein [Spirochaetaceae bacterium]